MKRLLDIEEAAEFLHVKVSTIYHLTSKKAIPHIKIGNLVRFTTEQLYSFIKQKSIRRRKRGPTPWEVENKERIKQYRKTANLKRKNKRRSRGECMHCGKPSGTYWYCKTHREKQAQKSVRIRDKYRKSGRCISCGRVLEKEIDGNNVVCSVCIERGTWNARMR